MVAVVVVVREILRQISYRMEQLGAWWTRYRPGPVTRPLAIQSQEQGCRRKPLFVAAVKLS